MKDRNLYVFIFLAFCVVFFLSSAKSQAENLISIQEIDSSYGVLKEQRLFDQKIPDPDSGINDFVAAMFLREEAKITFDLGGDKDIQYVQLISNNDNFKLSYSNDGVLFAPFLLKSIRENRAFYQYAVFETAISARFIRLSLQPGANSGAAYELTASPERPSSYPIVFPAYQRSTFSEAVNFELKKLKTYRTVKVAISFVLICVFFIAYRQTKELNTNYYRLFFVLGVLCFLNFHNPIGQINENEISHHYLGAKYFRELGHQDLYRAIARNEFEKGRGFLLERFSITDLSNYKKHPKSLSQMIGKGFDPESKFSPERWDRFSKDIDNIRGIFHYRHFPKILTDHGYNASPLYTSIFGTIFNMFIPSPLFFSVTGFVDVLFLIAGLALVWIGFGPFSGAVGALFVGLGEPWSILWSGNSVGRYLWFFLFCLGLTLYRKKLHFWGSLFLCLAGCLVVFPYVILAGVCFYLTYCLFAGRKLESVWPIISGAALGTFVGLIAPLITHNKEIYPRFLENIFLHKENISMNMVGLKPFFRFMGSELGILDDRGVVALFYVATILLLFLVTYLFVLAIKRELDIWVFLVLGGLLVFVLVPLSNYYYIWAIILVPLCIRSQFRLLMLFLFLLITNLANDSFFELALAHRLSCYAITAFFVLFYVSVAIDLKNNKYHLVDYGRD